MEKGLVGHQFPRYIIGYSVLPLFSAVWVPNPSKIIHSVNQTIKSISQLINQSLIDLTGPSNNQSASHLREKGGRALWRKIFEIFVSVQMSIELSLARQGVKIIM